MQDPKLPVSDVDDDTVNVWELVTVCWGEDESFAVSVTVNV